MLYYQGKYQDETSKIYIKDAKNIFSNKNTILLKDGSFYKNWNSKFYNTDLFKRAEFIKTGISSKYTNYKTRMLSKGTNL